nr:MAG TPA: hypothetical protein [Caudoviricetes sp.]
MLSCSLVIESSCAIAFAVSLGLYFPRSEVCALLYHAVYSLGPYSSVLFASPGSCYNSALPVCEAECVHTLLYVAEVAIQQHICDNLLSLVHIAVNLMFAPASGVEPLMPFSLGHSPAQDSPVMPILLTALLIYLRSVYSHLWPALGLSLSRNTRYIVSAYIRVFSWSVRTIIRTKIAVIVS